MSLKLTKVLFFFIFIFAPLAFGTTEAWSYAIMQIGTGAACLFFLIHVLKNRHHLYAAPGIIPLVLFLFYILFGLIPLPPFLVEFISPAAFKIHQTNQALSGISSWMTLSLNSKATLSEFFRYTTYVMFYVLTIQLLEKKGMLKTTALVIALFGGLLAFSSILQFYLTENMALWFRYTPTNSIVVGPYVNHNHYAGLMELIFPVVLGLFFFYRPRIGNTSLIKGIAEIFNQEKANIHILIGASALLIVISIFVSLSRGAMISTCLSLVFFTVFLLRRRISRGNTMLLIAIIMLSAISIGWFGWDQIFERFAKLKNAQGVIYEFRLTFWQDTIKIIKDFALTGAGTGTFSDIYPLYQSFQNEKSLYHAHNDYLELLAENGIIGFALAGCFLISFFYKTHTVFSKRRDAFSIYLYIGCITAMIALLFHSVVDFNMHVGANGLWFFFIAGIAVSAANTGIREQSLETRLPKISSLAPKIYITATISLLAILITLYNISNLAGIFYYSNISNYEISAQTKVPAIQQIEKIAGFASGFDPLNPDYKFIKANTAWFLNDIQKARHLFIETLALNPLNASYLNRFAIFLSKQQDTARTGLAFKTSTAYDKTNAEYTYQYGFWLLAQNDAKQGLEQMHETLLRDETYFDRVITSLIISGIDKTRIEEIIPDLPGSTIEYADFLASTGDISSAIPKYITALDMIETLYEKTIKTSGRYLPKIWSYYHKIFLFFKNHNDFKNATMAMEKAEKILPMDVRVKLALADLFFQQGILYKAIDKYDHALLLDPGNTHALKMIRKINP